MYSIMLVEDDRALCDQICSGLGKWGYTVHAAADFENIMPEFTRLKPHLVIMDVNLPCYDGFHWCRKIRELSITPVVFLSSRDSNMDVIMGVSTGGDDYITKPFSIRVLIAKIQAVLRRAYDYAAASSDYIEHKGLLLHIGEGFVSSRGIRVELTKNELKILTFLMNNKGRIVSRESLMQLLWDDDQYVNDNTLTANINRLRGKLEDVDCPNFIITRKGQGYMV